MIRKTPLIGLSVMIFVSCSGQLNWTTLEPEGEPGLQL
jgi:hypothetical protein